MTIAFKAINSKKVVVNLLDNRFIVNTGTIIAKGVNEHTIKEQVDLISNYASQYKVRVPPVVRLRTIATIGRSMGESHTYEFDEFQDVVCKQLDVSRKYLLENKTTDIKNNIEGLVFNHNNIIVRLVDWKVNDEGIPDFGNEVRGRITEDWKIAPFFEHVKENENGY